ncbi:MAG: hypothetical protein J5602_02250 [Clostridia bacterium]|nr:hypothetical protein [Clostridia bacterium]
MGQLCVGFARVNITPPMGIPVAGYYQLRLAERVLDELEINAVAVSDGGEKLLLLSADLLDLHAPFCNPILGRIARRTGIAEDHIFLACTHTHTGPKLNGDEAPELQRQYFDFLAVRMEDVCDFALRDLRPARMGYGASRAPRVAFIRRYRMKDGSTRTNPGVYNPDVVSPIGEVNDAVSLVRFDREGADTVLIVHFGCHPDTVGGCVISADWPGFVRRTLEKALDGVKCVFFNGAQGDVNHVNTAPTAGDGNDLFMDFDDVMRGYGHTRHMGRAVAGAALQAFDKVCWTDDSRVAAAQRVIRCPANRPRPEELPQARLYAALHSAGRDEEIPYQGMMLTTVVAEAERMLRLEHGPDSFALRLSAAVIGPVALAGVPGEPFTETGKTIAGAEGWGMVLPCCCTNGYENYFPLMKDYQDGGYEARSSLFRAGVAEDVAAGCLSLLDGIRAGRGGNL